MAPKAAAPKKKKLCFKRAGQVYKGDCVEIEGKYVRHGYGLQIWGAQTVGGQPVVIAVYEGFWDMGEMTGQGKMEYYDGSKYKGEFIKGSLNGTGRLEWSNGSVYDGMFHKNQMNGQGRFMPAGMKGWEGLFHRNCVVSHGGVWRNLATEQANLEKTHLTTGDFSEAPVYRVKRPDDLGAALEACRSQNLVPLLIRDDTFEEGMTPDVWLQKGYEEVDCKIHIRFVAKLKLRKQDYGAHVYDRIQRGILAGATIPFIFDTDADTASDKLDLRVPEEWCLENFFNPFTLPLEMFDPQIFHGRGFVQNFLPEEARRRSVLSVDVPLAAPPMEPAPVEPAPADAEAAADEAGDAAAEAAAAAAQARKVAFKFYPAVVIIGRVKSGAEDDEVRTAVGKAFAKHVPLHRCGFIFLMDGAQQEAVMQRVQ